MQAIPTPHGMQPITYGPPQPANMQNDQLPLDAKADYAFNPLQQPGSQYPNGIPLASLQEAPAPVDCPLCQRREMTTVHMQSGGYTHLMAAIMCFCCCLGCIPYMMRMFKNVQHKCGRCGANLALYHRSGSTEVQVKARP